MKSLKQTVFGILIFIILPFSITQAQNTGQPSLKIIGEAELVTGDIIADRDDNRDVNGNLTAGLRVKSDLTGLTFRADNGIVKTQASSGATLLFLSPNEKVVTVFKDGYIPLKIKFEDEGIELESGKVWELELGTTPQGNKEPVRFEVEPEDAIIFIDEKEYQVEGAIFDTELEEGEHSIKVFKPRYEVMEDQISVSSEQVNVFSYTITQVDPFSVKINSRPEGVSLFINDSKGALGKTPYRMNVYPGLIKIELRAEGYETMIDEFFLTEEIGDLFYSLNKAK